MKCGKEQSYEECVGDVEELVNKVRSDFIQPTDYDGADGRYPMWVRFPL